MLPKPLKGSCSLESYEKNCERYENILAELAKIGNGNLDRRVALKRLQKIASPSSLKDIENIIEELEDFEDC